MTIGDLIREGKLLRGALQQLPWPERHPYLNPEILRYLKRMAVLEVASGELASAFDASVAP